MIDPIECLFQILGRGAFVPVEQRGDGHPDAADPDIHDEVSDYIDGCYVGPHEAF